MLGGITSRNVCITATTVLDELAGGANPIANTPRQWGLVNALWDSLDRPGVARIDLNSLQCKPEANGASRLEVQYYAKRCPQTVVAGDVCTPAGAGKTNALYASVVVDTPHVFQFTQNPNDFRCVCEGQSKDFEMQMREAFEYFMNEISNDYATKFYAGVGNYFHGEAVTTGDCVNAISSATAPVTLNILNDVGNPQPRGLFPLYQNYRRMGIQRPDVFIVGGENLDSMLFEPATFNAFQGGQDVRSMSSLGNLYTDYTIDTVPAGANSHLFSFAAGAVFPVSWNEYAQREYILEGANTTKIVLDLGAPFGIPGRLLVDYTVYISECDNTIVHTMKLETGLCKIPQDAFSAECGQCHNYCLDWLTDCGPLDCTVFVGQ